MSLFLRDPLQPLRSHSQQRNTDNCLPNSHSGYYYKPGFTRVRYTGQLHPRGVCFERDCDSWATKIGALQRVFEVAYLWQRRWHD